MYSGGKKKKNKKMWKIKRGKYYVRKTYRNIT
jgi:hypothetical protein